ncbi:cytochrome P450 [Coprinellus micaceus]|uniref:Cytochrome P450 n=1 Tax=Coprinellus micaceus TaxID=71717 RepID=A0A4Y7SAM4_COPMI|nr:cytochrome P450 [Coprinellus micaceus]
MDSLQPIVERLHALVPTAEQVNAILEAVLSRLPPSVSSLASSVPSLSPAGSDYTSPAKLIPGSIFVALVVWPLLRRLARGPGPLDKVLGPEGAGFIAGHLPLVFTPNAWGFHEMVAKKYGGIAKLHGFFRKPMLFVYDPKALYHIFLKDQHTFEESDSFVGTNQPVFGDGLLSTLGEQHRRQRKMLNPVFSIAHMKRMIPTFFDITFQLREIFLEKTANGPTELDMSPLMTSTALEIISQCGLGQKFNTVQVANGADEHEYIKAMKMLLPLGASPFLLMVRTMVMPTLYRLKLSNTRFMRLVVNLVGIPYRRLRLLKQAVDVMHKTSVGIFNAKKKAVADGEDGDQTDFLSILMRENAKASKEDQLPDNEVIAQISTIMFAAMDTTSNALCRILYLLSKNQDAQERLRAEIREAKQRFGDGELSYDQLGSLTYLDAVIRETLRRYSPAAVVTRESNKDAILPLSKPITTTDGAQTQEVYVPKDTMVIISINSINNDPDIWGEDAHEWKPERWLKPLPEEVVEAKIPGVYSHLMTFIGGGRACIGFKFSEMEMKVVLYTLLDGFKFSPGKEIYWNMIGVATPSSQPEMKEFKSDCPLVVSRAD